MRGFLTLLRKELRDVRALAWICTLLPAVAILIVRWAIDALWQDDFAPAASRPRFDGLTVPLCAALGSAAIACDLFGRERSAGTLDALLALPVRRSTLWAAKALLWGVLSMWFLAVGGGAQILHLGVVDGEAAVFRWLEVAASSGLSSNPLASDGVLASVAVLGTGACVLLVSTLGLRGLGSLLVGLGLAAAVGAACRLLAETTHVGWGLPAHDEVLPWALLCGGAALAASLAAFTIGRAWLGRGLRALATAVVVFAAVAAPPAWASVRAARTVVPGTGSWLIRALPRADGRFLATLWQSRHEITAPFVLDLTTGEFRDLGGPFTHLPPPSRAEVNGRPFSFEHPAATPAWSREDGSLRVVDLQGTQHFLRRVDPATGALLADPVALEDQDARQLRWMEWVTRDRWELMGNTLAKADGDPRKWAITVRAVSGWARSEKRHVATVRSWKQGGIVSGNWLVHQPMRGVLALRRLESGPSERVVASALDARRDVEIFRVPVPDGADAPQFDVAPFGGDGRGFHVRVRTGGEKAGSRGAVALAAVVRVEDAPVPGDAPIVKRTAIPESLLSAWAVPVVDVRGGEDAFAAEGLLLASGASGGVLFDPASGRSVSVASQAAEIFRIADGSLLLVETTAEGFVVERVEADFSGTRTLWRQSAK